MRRSATPLPNLRLQRRNFWKEPLSDAGLIVCYLFPKAMTRLKDHIPPDTLVLSHTFAIPGWQPIATLVADDLYKTPIYLYQT